METSSSGDLGAVVDLETGLRALLVVSVVSAVAPFVCAMLARFPVPQVLVLIVGGVLIGPEVAGWAPPGPIELVANVGLGFLCLLPGYELELDHFWERSGRLELAGWLVAWRPVMKHSEGPAIADC
jgi:Kef-type K+ transport system membrane component KefB